MRITVISMWSQNTKWIISCWCWASWGLTFSYDGTWVTLATWTLELIECPLWTVATLISHLPWSAWWRRSLWLSRRSLWSFRFSSLGSVSECLSDLWRWNRTRTLPIRIRSGTLLLQWQQLGMETSIRRHWWAGSLESSYAFGECWLSRSSLSHWRIF